MSLYGKPHCKKKIKKAEKIKKVWKNSFVKPSSPGDLLSAKEVSASFNLLILNSSSRMLCSSSLT